MMALALRWLVCDGLFVCGSSVAVGVQGGHGHPRQPSVVRNAGIQRRAQQPRASATAARAAPRSHRALQAVATPCNWPRTDRAAESLHPCHSCKRYPARPRIHPNARAEAHKFARAASARLQDLGMHDASTRGLLSPQRLFRAPMRRNSKRDSESWAGAADGRCAGTQRAPSLPPAIS